MQVKEVMTHGVECIRPDDSIAAAAQKMKDLDVGALPICGENDRLVGMITDRDITEAARLMKENQIRRLVVLNREKRLVGIVSLGDLAVDTRDEELAGATLEAVSEPVQPRR